MINFKNFFKKDSLGLPLAAILIGALFYVRFLPRIARDLWVHMTYQGIFLRAFSIIGLIANIYYILKYLGYLKESKKIRTEYRYLSKLNDFFLSFMK